MIRMILTIRTLVLLLAAALTGGAAVVGVSSILSVSGDAGSDYGLDTNGNAKYDWLVVEATVNLPDAGTWSIGAGLMTATAPTSGSCGGAYPIPVRTTPPAWPGSVAVEWSIAWAYEQYFFPSGTQTIRMAFPGTDIFRFGADGPYVVRATFSLGGYPCIYCVYNASPVPGSGYASLTWNYTTGAYRASDFEEPLRPAYFSGGHTDSAVDVDHDGSYDFLELRADVHVNTAGTYNLNGYLSSTQAPPTYDPSMPIAYVTVAYGYGDVSLQLGDASVFLRFRGDQIRMAGVDGPWDFSLTLYGPTDIVTMNGTIPPRPIGGALPPMPPSNGDFAPVPIYPETLCGTTGSYLAGTFDDTVELLAYTGVFEEATSDWDLDGLYDALAIRAQVDVYVRAGFDIRGTLRSSDGQTDIAFVETQAYVPEGIGSVEVSFAGASIRARGIDGPYQVVLSITPMAGGFDPTTTYTTRAYRATDFDEGCSNCSSHWINDLGAKASGPSSVVIDVGIVRGNDLLTYVVEDVLTVTVVDASGSTVWSVVDRVYLPSGGSSQSFTYEATGLSSGTYTVFAILGPSDRPTDVRSVDVTL